MHVGIIAIATIYWKLNHGQIVDTSYNIFEIYIQVVCKHTLLTYNADIYLILNYYH